MSAPDPRYEDLLSLVRRQSDRWGDRTFMTFGDGESMSFSDLERRIAGFRRHLLDLGIAPGDRVALMLKNSLFYPVAWLGILSAGAVAVPMNSRLGELDARFVLQHSGAVGLVVDDRTQDVARAAAPADVRAVVVARSGEPMQELATDEDVAAPLLRGDSLANIQYTSGTTGFPKGCLLRHLYWQRMGTAASAAMGITENDTLITSQPHSYVDPQWNAVAALQRGAHLVLLDSFHPTTFMRDVARFEVTLFYCLGVMPTLLLKQPATAHDRNNSLTRVFCSAIPAEQHAVIEQRWGAPWFEIFGMTETGVNVGVAAGDHDRFVGTGCIGRALPHNEVAVVDEQDRPVPPGAIGEMVLRGLGMMDGYHNDREATTAFFRGGWAHTGDLVESDEDGYIYYRGRRKEMIRRAGENIAPIEIEAALASHHDVIECAVVPVPDPDLGEEIKAYVVASSPVEATVLGDYLRSKIAIFKVPRYWEFRASLPHTPSEKVAKHQLLSEDPLAHATDIKAATS